MESERRSSLRLKRKPLSDCTNTIQNHDKNPSKTLIKPPKKPSNNFNNKLNFPISSPPKSHTSTGSNNSPNSFTDVPSDLRDFDPSAPSIPTSNGGGTACRNFRVTIDNVQRRETTRKDKGKMVAETPTIHICASPTTNPLHVSSSASPGHSSHSGTQAVQNQDMHAEVMKGKGKSAEKSPITQSSALFTSRYLNGSSSSGYSFSETSPVQHQKLDEERRKAKGKMVTLNMDASEPSTPHVPVGSLTVSGTSDRPLTDYNQRRRQQGRKHGADKINFPLSCLPDQRSKKMGLELNSDRCVSKFGQHTDPLPVRNKKRSHDKHLVHIMPKEEIDKLKTYFADIDAFELPVEEVESENDLE